MATTAKRLYGPALLSNADALLYTVPSATKALPRHFHVENNDAANSHTLFLSVGADAAGTRIFDAYVIAAGAILDWYPYMPLAAAETIRGHSGTTNVLGITIGGDEISL